MEKILINMQFRFFISRYMWWLSSLSNIYVLPSKIRPELLNIASAPVNVNVCTGRTCPHLMKWVTNDTHFGIILAKKKSLWCRSEFDFFSIYYVNSTSITRNFNLGTSTRYLVVALELQNSVTLDNQMSFLYKSCWFLVIRFWVFIRRLFKTL